MDVCFNFQVKSWNYIKISNFIKCVFLFPFQLVALFSAYLILQHKNMILVKLHKYFQVMFQYDNQKSNSMYIVECNFKRSDKHECEQHRAGTDTVTLASLSMVRLENIWNLQMSVLCVVFKLRLVIVKNYLCRNKCYSYKTHLLTFKLIVG